VLAVDAASGGYVFRHALVQEAIYDDLLPVQRGPLHAAYARALDRRIEQRGGASGSTGATADERGQLAYHWYATHDQGQALLACVRAGQAAESASALAEALEYYQRALELWDQVPEAATRSPLDRVTLLRRAAEVANLAGQYDRWPPSPPSRHRKSWPARWPRTASSSCWRPTIWTRRSGARRRSPSPGRWATGPWRATP